MRAFISLMAVLVCSCCSLFADFAPVRIAGHNLRFVLNEATGEFAQYKGHQFKTTYLEDNSYEDMDLTTGLINDRGTYHYFKTGENSAEVHYQVSAKDSPWVNKHLIEKWIFTSPSVGTVEGVHAGDFDCGYKGSFQFLLD